MPSSYSMTWEAGPRRWRKMYLGKLYVVSCRELGVPDTKERSYQAANAWWAATKAEIGGEARWPNHEIVEELIADRDNALEFGAFPEALELHGKLVRVANPEVGHEVAEAIVLGDESDLSPDRIALARGAGITIPEGVDPNLLEYLFGATRIALDRRQRRPRNYSDPKAGDKSIAAQVSRYLGQEKSRVEGGHISVGEYEIAMRSLEDFKHWIGGHAEVSSIDADRLDGWWSHLLGLKISVETKKKKLRHARSFVEWISEKGLIARPTNLHSKRHRFGGGLKEITTVPAVMLKELIDTSPGQLKLHLLLMANCGMTQIDITDLHPGEIEWESGRIKRKRSKTSDRKNVPIVDYPLWPATVELLRRYGHRTGRHALLTQSGKPWVRDVLKSDGNRSKVDNIKSNFAHIKKRKDLKYSMKSIRKTSASLLETQSEFARYATMFLGHSPRTIADRHYVAPDQASFDRAVLWLGEKYGFMSRPEIIEGI